MLFLMAFEMIFSHKRNLIPAFGNNYFVVRQELQARLEYQTRLHWGARPPSDLLKTPPSITLRQAPGFW
jgi:hypothetical protein